MKGEEALLVPLDVDDVDAVARLEEGIFPEDPWTWDMVLGEFTGPGRHCVGALVGERLVGWAAVRLGPDADVMTVGVLPTHRGRGIGRALAEDLLDACEAADVERVFLEVRVSNRAAQGLYSALGFVHAGRVRAYFRNPVEDAWIMVRDLREGAGGALGE